MLLTSQNRNSVVQVNSAPVRGEILAAVVAHRPASSKRPFPGMRRTQLPLGSGSTFRYSEQDLTGAHRQLPGGCRPDMQLRPQLWARLVLSKLARG